MTKPRDPDARQDPTAPLSDRSPHSAEPTPIDATLPGAPTPSQPEAVGTKYRESDAALRERTSPRTEAPVKEATGGPDGDIVALDYEHTKAAIVEATNRLSKLTEHKGLLERNYTAGTHWKDSPKIVSDEGVECARLSDSRIVNLTAAGVTSDPNDKPDARRFQLHVAGVAYTHVGEVVDDANLHTRRHGVDEHGQPRVGEVSGGDVRALVHWVYRADK